MPAVGGTGLALPLNLALPVRGFVEVGQRAEAAGYDRLWAAEAGNNDAFGLLTAVALGTSTVGLATGWHHGPSVDNGARWDAAELGPVVDGLLAEAPSAAPVYGTG